MRVILITGISGSGKSIALNVLEDDGYFCIDNLPLRFLQEVIASFASEGLERLAVAIDVRGGEGLIDLPSVVLGLGRFGHDVKVLFLDARTEILVNRYSETRRRHPLSQHSQPGQSTSTLIEAIERERELLSAIEGLGVSIDTSDLHPNLLRAWVRDIAGTQRAGLTLLFESFAYKKGVPLDADLVFDVRCLPNPFYTAELRPLSGLDAPVAEFLNQIPAVGRMIDCISGFLEEWLPHFVLENRSYLTVAIGCTGGQHRSVYCVEQIAARFREREQVLVRHRSLAARQQALQQA